MARKMVPTARSRTQAMGGRPMTGDGPGTRPRRVSSTRAAAGSRTAGRVGRPGRGALTRARRRTAADHRVARAESGARGEVRRVWSCSCSALAWRLGTAGGQQRRRPIRGTFLLGADRPRASAPIPRSDDRDRAESHDRRINLGEVRSRSDRRVRSRVSDARYFPYPAATMLAWIWSSTESGGAPIVMAPSNQIPTPVLEPSPPVPRMIAPCFFCGL